MIRWPGILIVLGVLVGNAALAQDEEQSARDLITRRQFTEARAIYQRLSSDDPQNLDYQIWIARLSAWLHEYAPALEIYDSVLQREPRNSEAMVGKAYVYMWQQRFVEAGEVLARAGQSSPDNTDVLMAQARLLHYQNRNSAARERLLRALEVDPKNQEARELDAELGRAHPFELRLGYVHDRFSFAAPGNMGELDASYLGENGGRIGLQYEEWSRFNERDRRGGFNFSRRYGMKWWLRGGAMWGPGATVVPRGEYTAGISRTLPHRFVLDGDYRYLGFKAADAHIAAPALSYYFAKPRWIQVTSYSAWARLGAKQHFSNSWLFRYYQQVARPLRLHAGYARGNESFEAFSIDKLAVFEANTYLAGADVDLSRTYAAGIFCVHQRRSNGFRETSAGFSLTLRK